MRSDDTFFYSKRSSTGRKGFNRSIWRFAETTWRKLGERRAAGAHVITGPFRRTQSRSRSARKTDVCKSSIELPVPSQNRFAGKTKGQEGGMRAESPSRPAMYKIVYDPEEPARLRRSCSRTSITPGATPAGAPSTTSRRTGSVSTIEDLTGLTFFPAIPDRVRRQMKATAPMLKFR